jgi:ATP-binding cassette subfamily F protein uup
LLEALLIDWPGTLLLVSHDRAFIDNVVTSTLVFQEQGEGGRGKGEVKEYVGGYEDWLRQRPDPRPGLTAPTPGGRIPSDPAEPSDPASPRKLTYREQQELKQLPAQIEALEVEQQALNARVAGPDFYRESGEAIRQTLARQESLHELLLQAYARWDELDSRSG